MPLHHYPKAGMQPLFLIMKASRKVVDHHRSGLHNGTVIHDSITMFNSAPDPLSGRCLLRLLLRCRLQRLRHNRRLAHIRNHRNQRGRPWAALIIHLPEQVMVVQEHREQREVVA